MLILARHPQRIFGSDFPRVSKPLRSGPQSSPATRWAFIVVSCRRRVFLKIFPRVLQIMRVFAADHARTLHGLWAHVV